MKTTDRMLEKIRVILEGYRSGDHINVQSLSNKISRLDRRIKMGENRVGKLLSFYKNDIVIQVKGRWFKK